MVKVIGCFKISKPELDEAVPYSLLFLKDSMVFVWRRDQDGGMGAGFIVGGSVGGLVGAVVGEAVERAVRKSLEKKDEKTKSLDEMTAKELVKIDRKNFEILYKDISSVEMIESREELKGFRTGIMRIDGRKKVKVYISSGQNFQECVEIVRIVLSDKLDQSPLS